MDIDFSTIVTNALSADNTIRRNAEQVLQNLAYQDFGAFLLRLADELQNENKSLGARQMSATIIKNCLVFAKSLREKWYEMDSNKKTEIKNAILSALASSVSLIRRSTATVIAGICKIEQPLETNWPEIIASLCQNSYHTDINIKLSALQTIGYICDELNIKTTNPATVDQILTAIIQNLESNISQLEVVNVCLSSLLSCIPLAQKNFNSAEEAKIIMKAIMGAGNTYSNNDDILEKLCKIFINIADNYYDQVESFMDQISEFSFYLIKNKESHLVQLSFEFWSSIGEIDVTRVKMEMESTHKNVKLSKRYLQKYFGSLFPLLLNNISTYSAEDFETNQFTLSSLIQDILALASKVVDSDTLGSIIQAIEINISADDSKLVNMALLLFAAVLETNQKIRMSDVVLSQLGKTLKLLMSNNSIIIQSATLLFIKISKYYSKLLDATKLSHIVPLLLSILTATTDNKIAINICITLTNLIKGLGDFDTSRGTNKFSPFFEGIFSTLLGASDRPEAFNSNANLGLHCFVAINTLIEYSSHDKQARLPEIMNYFLDLFEKTLNSENIKTLDINIVFDLQCHYANLFKTVIHKMIHEVNLDVATRLYNDLEASFKMRQSVYDEALLVISALAENLREKFTPIFPRFTSYLEYTLGLYNEYSLLRSAVLCLATCVKTLEMEFKNYSDKYIPLLITLLSKEEVTRYAKTLSISTLGEICLAINQHFLPYLANVMQLLLAAAETAASNPEDEDEETDDYLKDLRYDLIEAFTCISFGLDDCGKKDLFIAYVPPIIGFIKSITADHISKRADILKSMICFIGDMVSSYGREMNTLVDIAFINRLVEIYKELRKGNYEDSVIQAEKKIKHVLSF